MQFILFSFFIHSSFGWDFAVVFSQVLHFFTFTVGTQQQTVVYTEKCLFSSSTSLFSVSQLPNVPVVSNKVIKKNFRGAELMWMGQNNTM